MPHAGTLPKSQQSPCHGRSIARSRTVESLLTCSLIHETLAKFMETYCQVSRTIVEQSTCGHMAKADAALGHAAAALLAWAAAFFLSLFLLYLALLLSLATP